MKLRTERKHDALLDGAGRYCGVAAAIIGGTIGGALISSSASKSAAGEQAASSDRAADMSMQQYQQTRQDQAPWREAGQTALSQLSGGLAPGGAFGKSFTMADYQADPGYQFRIQQGEQGIDRAAGARGSRYSGATLKALARFNSDQASQEYGKAYDRYNNDVTTRFNRLASVAGVGQTATAQTAAAGQQAVMTAGQAIQNAGTARASGYVGTANAINGGIGQAVNSYQLSKLAGSGAGGGNWYNVPEPAYTDSVQNVLF